MVLPLVLIVAWAAGYGLARRAMSPIEQMLVRLSSRDRRDIRPLQAAQASIERGRHLLWHGRRAQAGQELVRFAHHSKNFARSGAEPKQVVTRDFLRTARGCAVMCKTTALALSATIIGITAIDQYRRHALRDASAKVPHVQIGSAGRMLESLQRIGDALRVDHAGDENEIGTMIARRPSWQVLWRMYHVLRHVHDHRAGIADVQQSLYAQHVRPMRLQQHAQPDPEARPVERTVECQ